AHLARRLPEAGDGAVWNLRAAGRDEAGLNLARHVQLLLQPVAFGCFAVEVVVDHGDGRLLGNAGEDAEAAAHERAIIGGWSYQQRPDQAAARVEGQHTG